MTEQSEMEGIVLERSRDGRHRARIENGQEVIAELAGAHGRSAFPIAPRSLLRDAHHGRRLFLSSPIGNGGRDQRECFARLLRVNHAKRCT